MDPTVSVGRSTASRWRLFGAYRAYQTESAISPSGKPAESLGQGAFCHAESRQDQASKIISTARQMAKAGDIRPLADTTAKEAPLIIVCGLAAEAKIARGPGLIVIKGGGDRRRLTAELEAAAPGARAVISFGVAGGIAPGLKPGDVHVADAILTPEGDRFATDRAWSAAICRDLGVSLSTFFGVDRPLDDLAGKSAIYKATRAAVVDMESHIVARVAVQHRLPLAAIRVITDPAEKPLPHAASVGMRSDGGVDLAAVFRSIIRNPTQLPRLVGTGLDARAAFASLFRCRQMLGPSFAFLDFAEPLLNVL